MRFFKKDLKNKHTILKNACIRDVWYKMTYRCDLNQSQFDTLYNYNTFLDNLTVPEKKYLINDIKKYEKWMRRHCYKNFIVTGFADEHRSKVYNFK